jgi:hypothetical protein
VEGGSLQVRGARVKVQVQSLAADGHGGEVLGVVLLRRGGDGSAGGGGGDRGLDVRRGRLPVLHVGPHHRVRTGGEEAMVVDDLYHRTSLILSFLNGGGQAKGEEGRSNGQLVEGRHVNDVGHREVNECARGGGLCSRLLRMAGRRDFRAVLVRKE